MRDPGLQMFGEPLEDALRGQPIPVADALERLRDRRFNSTLTERVHSGAAFRETQYRSSSITGIVGTGQESLSDQTVEHSGQRARMHVQHHRQIARRHPGEQTDDAEHQPLWARDADVTRHSFRDAL